MEPDIGKLLEKVSEANEEVSRAFIRQSLAWNSLNNAIREIREGRPTLFDQKDD